MTYHGYVKDSAIVVDEPILLPDGTEVRVEPVSAASRKTLAERFKDVIGTVPDLPEDMTRNHDHYIHGTPKK